MLSLAIPVYKMVAKEMRLGSSFGGISLWDLRPRAVTGNPLSAPRVGRAFWKLSLGMLVWGNQCGGSITGTSNWVQPEGSGWRCQSMGLNPGSQSGRLFLEV